MAGEDAGVVRAGKAEAAVGIVLAADLDAASEGIGQRLVHELAEITPLGEVPAGHGLRVGFGEVDGECRGPFLEGLVEVTMS